MKPVTTRSPSRVGLKPATVRIRGSRMKPIARPKRNPLRIPSHPQSPNNGALFVFARPSQRIATPAPAKSPVPTDVTGNRLTAPAHTETRPAPPPRRNGQPTDSTCTQSASLAPRIVLKPPRKHRNKFSARTATFLRSRIVAGRQIADRSPKTQQIGP